MTISSPILISTTDKSAEQIASEMFLAMQKAKLLASSPFVGFVMDEGKHSYEAYLINPSSVAYTRVCSLTGGVMSDDDGISETSKVTNEKGALQSHSALLLEKNDLDELDDYLVWYNLDLYAQDENKPLQVQFSLPKLSWIFFSQKYETSLLPVLEKEGMRIELDQRIESKDIEETVKKIDMDGGYRPSASHIST